MISYSSTVLQLDIMDNKVGINIIICMLIIVNIFYCNMWLIILQRKHAIKVSEYPNACLLFGLCMSVFDLCLYMVMAYGCAYCKSCSINIQS